MFDLGNAFFTRICWCIMCYGWGYIYLSMVCLFGYQTICPAQVSSISQPSKKKKKNENTFDVVRIQICKHSNIRIFEH